jgi:hypothetical protein
MHKREGRGTNRGKEERFQSFRPSFKRFRPKLGRVRSGDTRSSIHDPNASQEVGASACKVEKSGPTRICPPLPFSQMPSCLMRTPVKSTSLTRYVVCNAVTAHTAGYHLFLVTTNIPFCGAV